MPRPRPLLPPRLCASVAVAALGVSTLTAFGLPASTATAASADVTAAIGIQRTTAAAPVVGATVTTGADSGPGSLREAVAATQGTGLAVAIDASVPVITLDSPLIADGDLTVVGTGRTGTSVVAAAGQVVLGVSAGSTADLRGLTVVGAAPQYDGAAAVLLTDVVYDVSTDTTAQFAAITGDVILDRVTLPATTALEVSSIGGDMVLRGSTLAMSSFYGDTIRGSLVIEDSTIDASTLQMPLYVEVGDIGGDLRMVGVQTTGPTSTRFMGVGGDVVITDVTQINHSTEVGTGPTVSDVAGAVTVTGLHLDGSFSQGLSIAGGGDGVPAHRLTVTDFDFTAPVSENWVGGIQTSSYGFGGIELRDIRIDGATESLTLSSPGQSGDGTAMTAPVVLEDITLTGRLVHGYATGVQIDNEFASITATDLAISGVTRGFLVDGNSTAGSALEMHRVGITTPDENGISAVSIRGQSFGQVLIADSEFSGSARELFVIDTASSDRAGLGDSVRVERSTFALTPNSSDASVMNIRTSADVTVANSTLVALAETESALIDHTSNDAGSLSVAYSTLLGSDAVASDSAGAVSIDASVLDGVALTSTGSNATITRSALTGDRDLTGVTVDEGTLVGVDPAVALGPLQDNGGQTRTMAPVPGSVLIDAAGARTEVTTDQRGAARPSLGTDIGAVEIDPGTVAITPSVTVDGGSTAVLTVTRTGADTDQYPLDATVTVPAGTAVLGTDYLAPVGTLTFPAGVTSLEIGVDTLAVTGGADSTLTVRVTTPAGQQADATVDIVQAAPPAVIDPPTEVVPPTPTPEPTAPAGGSEGDPGTGTETAPQGQGSAAPAAEQPTVRSGVLAVTGSGLAIGAWAALVLALGTGLTWLVRRVRA